MKEARDMVGISVPFVLGVACAALLGRPELSVNVLTILASLLLYMAVSERSFFCYYLMFWLCGIFVYSSHALCVIPGRQGAIASFCAASLEELQHVIDSVPFREADTSALIKALLSGDRTGLSKNLTGVFRSAGASHILALSGLHLGILYALTASLLKVLGNSPGALRIRGIFSVAICTFYTIMTGAGPSVVRALIFVVLNEIARNSPERKASLLRKLLAASLIQLSISPDSITSPGFQLSYLAMLGIALLYPSLSSWYPDVEGTLWPVKKVWDAAAMSISCQLFTAPLCWVRFHTFPKYFLLTNLIALPVSSVVMISSILCVALWSIGLCPHFLVKVCEAFVQMLVNALETISVM